MLRVRTLATGVDAFDRIVGGGLPEGSVTLLLGETGAGAREFAHSAVLSSLAGTTELRKVAYVSMGRAVLQIERELAALAPGFEADQIQGFHFCDLSPYYFRETIAPTEWTGAPDLVTYYPGGDLFGAIYEFLEKHGKGALVVLDSLSDFLSDPDMFRELLPFLRSIQRFAAANRSLVFGLLPSGILPLNQEAALQEASDGTLVFSWLSGNHGIKRRQMWVKDFRGLTPTLTEKNMTEFTAEITAGMGFGLKSLSRIG